MRSSSYRFACVALCLALAAAGAAHATSEERELFNIRRSDSRIAGQQSSARYGLTSMFENLLDRIWPGQSSSQHMGATPLSLLQTRSTQEGTCDGLLVEVLAAKDLEKADFFSTTDAYVYVTAKSGGKVVKSTTGKKHPHTPTLRNNENPEWTTENKFCWQSESPVDEVKLAIMDKDSWTSDDPIGHVTVAKADFPNYSQEGGAEAEVVSSNKKDKLRFRIVEAGSTTNEAAPNAAGASAPTATPAAASSTSEAGDAPPSENTATTVGATTTPSAAPETTTTPSAAPETTEPEATSTTAPVVTPTLTTPTSAPDTVSETAKMTSDAPQNEASMAPAASDSESATSGPSTDGGAGGPFSWACQLRVRKDWTDLTQPERDLYLAAVNKLKKTPIPGKECPADSPCPGANLYDAYVMIHGETQNKAYAHQTSGFLPWHRKYLLEYESSLRALGPEFKCVTIPYWDWSTESYACAQKKAKLGDGTCKTYHGASQLLTDFGGPGDKTKTENTHGSSGAGPVGCVTTGPFAGWVDHNGKCLSRGVNWNIKDQKPFTGRMNLAKITRIKTYGKDYQGFRSRLEGVPHGSTHNYLGGHMRSFISPADPIFFSHHAYVDKIWASWQDCHDYDKISKKSLGTEGDETVEHECKGDEDACTHCYCPTLDYDDDRVTDPMVFNYPVQAKQAGIMQQCSKATAGPCSRCVNRKDSWCKSNDWDSQCKGMCNERHCKGVCGGGQRELLSMHTKGATVIPTWRQEEVTPRSMHWTGDLGDRSYYYAPDEFERELLKEKISTVSKCKFDWNADKIKQASESLFVEIMASHHAAESEHGKAARAYARHMKQVEVEVRSQYDNLLEVDEASLSEHMLKKQIAAECKSMSITGDYAADFKCDADQPRDYIIWIGPKHYKEIKKKGPAAMKLMFQDPCCAASEDSIQEKAAQGPGDIDPDDGVSSSGDSGV